MKTEPDYSVRREEDGAATLLRLRTPETGGAYYEDAARTTDVVAARDLADALNTWLRQADAIEEIRSVVSVAMNLGDHLDPDKVAEVLAGFDGGA